MFYVKALLIGLCIGLYAKSVSFPSLSFLCFPVFFVAFVSVNMSEPPSEVSMTDDVRKTIKAIKEEVAGQHRDDDIYALLKEFDMDSDKTTQRLLYLDTFEEVKKKRGRRVNMNSQEYRWNWGKGKSKDPVGGRNSSPQKGNGVNTHTQRDVRAYLPVLQKTENSRSHPVANSNGSMGLYNRNSSYKHIPLLSAVNVVNHPKDGPLGTIPPLPTASVKQPSISASKPISTILPGIQVEQEKSTSSTLASLLGIYCSAPHVPVSVGTMKGEVGSRSIVAESSATIRAGSKSISAHDVANGIQACDGSLALSSNQDSKSVQQLNGCSKVVSDMAGTAAPQNEEAIVMLNKVCSLKEATTTFDVEFKKFSNSEETTSKLDMEQPKKFNAPVIFPDLVKVPDAYKDKLIFGSIDSSIVSAFVPSDRNCSAVVVDDDVASNTIETNENDNCMTVQQNYGSLLSNALDSLNEEQHVIPSFSEAGSPKNATSSGSD